MNSENNSTTTNNNAPPSYDQHLDARGLSCPLPLLKAKQSLNGLGAGQLLFVQASDPGAWDDFASYAELSKHELMLRKKSGDHFQFLLQKGE